MIDNTDIPKIENPEFVNLLNLVGILTRQDSHDLLRKFHGNALAILTYLVKEGIAEKNELCKLWGDSLGFAYLELGKSLFQTNAVQKIPEKFARRHNMIAIYKLGESVTIATSDPSNTFIRKELERLMGCPVSLIFSFPPDINDAIEVQYQTSRSLKAMVKKIRLNSLFEASGKITAEQLKTLSGDKAIVEFTRGLLLLGIKERARDIHLEPGRGTVRIRFRIDGVLQEKMALDIALHAPITSHLKLLAGADMNQRQIPQDGRISLSLMDKTINLRFSSSPTIYGEKIVLRMLGGLHAYDIPKLSDLFFSKHNYDKLMQITDAPNGMFFVTGPAGSGKTTTLYSVLRHINRPEINIMTIEDPVEYRLNGVNQVQTNPDIGLDFVSGIRSFLRQDPDVILVGEIRDAETAEMASRAAAAGHLVFASLHTDSAPETMVRFIEIGSDMPFLGGPSVIGVMAQRLVRRLCDQCKERYELTPGEIGRMFVWDGKGKVFFYREKGCPHCSHIGFSGRIGIHEFFITNPGMHPIMEDNAAFPGSRRSGDEINFQTMRYDGMKKVLRGLTTIKEVNKMIAGAEHCR